METLPGVNQEGKNLFVEDADQPKSVMDLIRLTPGPKVGHRPLAHALSHSPHYGPEFVEKCTTGWKRSEGKIEDFVETFRKHSSDDHKTPQTWTDIEYSAFITAFTFVFTFWLRPTFKSFVFHWCDLFFLKWSWSTSSCWPYVLSKATATKAAAWNKFTEFGRNMVHTIKNKIRDPWSCVLPLKQYLIMGYNRFHITRSDVFSKIRLVFGCPMIQLATEMQIFYGYLFMLKFHHTSPIAYGREIYNGGMVYVNSMITTEDVIFVDDISGFDFHVPFWMVFIIMYTVFDNFISFSRYWPCFKDGGKWFYDSQDPNTMRTKFYRVLVICFRWISQLKVLLPTGHYLIRMFAFLPSGMFLTTFLDSAINLITFVHCALLCGVEPSEISFTICLGDDLLFTIKRSVFNRLRISPNEFYRRFDATRKRLYNLTSGGKARYVGNDRNSLIFLHYRNQDGRPIRDLEELTAGALVRERHVRPEHLASVCVGLAYAAVATCPHYHACLEEAYNFCMRVSAEKGEVQEPHPDDRFMTELLESDDTLAADPLRFPSYEEVLSRVTSPNPNLTLDTHHSLNHELFVYPNTAFSHMFESVEGDLRLPMTFLTNLRERGTLV